MSRALPAPLVATLRSHGPILIPYTALFWLLRAWFVPGLIVGEDFNPSDWLNPAALRHSFPWPDLWAQHQVIGYSLQVRLPLYPLMAAGGLLERLGLSWAGTERVICLLPLFALLVFAPYRFGLRYLRSRWGACAMALVFALNTWTVGLIQRGHLPALIAYALLPLALDLSLAAARRPHARRAVALAIVVTLQGIFEIRYAYLTVLTVTIAWMVLLALQPRRMWRGDRARFVAIWVLSAAVLNLYWLVPTLLVPIYVPPSFVSLAEFIGTSGQQSMLRALATFYPFYTHVESNSGFALDALAPWSMLLGALTLVGLALAWRSRTSKVLAAIWVFGVILLSGPLGPYGALDQWAFVHVPFMNAFRDITKVTGIVAFVAAFGIARVVIVAGAGVAVALRRLRARGEAAAAVVFAIGYLLAMQGAYNPVRFSNFAVTRLTRQDRALARFIATSPAGRIVFFPQIPEWYGGDPRHGPVAAAVLSSFAWPYGFGAVNPDLSNLLSFWSTPAAPQLLCAVGARDVIVIPDRFSSIYEPWQVPVQRGEAEEFFGQRPWLRRVAMPGAARRALDRYAVFTIHGCGRRRPRLYAATLPVVAAAAPPSLNALVSLSGADVPPTAIFAGQQAPDESAFHEIANAVIGSDVPDRVRSVYRVAPAAARPQIAYESRVASLEPKVSRSYLFTPVGRPASGGRAPRYIKGGFDLARSGRAKLTVLAQPMTDATGTVATLSLERARVANASNARLLTDPRALSATPLLGTYSASSPRSARIEALAQGARYGIVNPYPVPVSADLRIDGLTANGNAPLAVVARLGSREAAATAPPGWLRRWLGIAASVTLRSVTLAPGYNTLVVLNPALSPGGSPLVSAGFALDRAIQLVSVAQTEQRRPLTLPAAVRASRSAAVITVAAHSTGGREALATLELARGLHLPLGIHPTLTMRYAAPQLPLQLDAVLMLRSPRGIVRLTEPLPPDARFAAFDVAAAVDRALRRRLAARASADRENPQRLVRLFTHPHSASSDYTLVGFEVTMLQPRATSTSGSTATILDASVSIAAGPVASPLRVVDRTVDFRRATAARIARARNVRVTTLRRLRGAVVLSATLEASQQRRPPEDVRPGDHVDMHLQGGREIAGDVTGLSTGYFDLLTVTGPVAVRRSAVATIDEVVPDVRTGFDLEVPLPAFRAHDHLLFDLRNESAMIPSIRLVFRDPRNGHTFSLYPQDRSRANPVAPVMPPEWVSQADDYLAAAPVALGAPSASGSAAPPTWAHYDIPVDAVRASELRAHPRAALQMLLVRFALPPGARVDQPSSADVTVAGVQLAHWRRDTPHRDAGAVGAAAFPSIQLDGRAVHLHWRAVGVARYAAGASVALGRGAHVLAALPGAGMQPIAAMLTFGSPRASSARVTDVRRLSATELEARVSGGSPLLIMPTGFSAGWQLAVVPRGAHPTGNPIVDYLRFRGAFVKPGRHVIVDGSFNGWNLRHVRGEVIVIFSPEPISRLALLLELVLIAAGVLALRARTGG